MLSSATWELCNFFLRTHVDPATSYVVAAYLTTNVQVA